MAAALGRGCVKKFVVGVVIGVALATAERTLAADNTLPTKAPPAPTARDWTGFYAGVHYGYAAGSSRWSATQSGATTPSLSGSLDMFNAFDAPQGTGSYLHGLQGGYNYMLPSRVVIGAEADVSFPSLLAGSATLSSPLVGQASYQDEGGVFRHRTRPRRLCTRQLAVLCNGRLRL